MNPATNQKQWVISWKNRAGLIQPLEFELDQGYRYRVVVHSEEDKNQFLDLFLHPPETALVAPDGGLLGNLKIDENLTLPLGYHGAAMDSVEQRIVELFGACGVNEAELRSMLVKVPSQLSLFQKRLVGFVRSALGNPRVMVYDSIWDGVSKAEIEQILRFDEYFRRYAPVHTAVFVGYDTQLDPLLHAHSTFTL